MYLSFLSFIESYLLSTSSLFLRSVSKCASQICMERRNTPHFLPKRISRFICSERKSRRSSRRRRRRRNVAGRARSVGPAEDAERLRRGRGDAAGEIAGGTGRRIRDDRGELPSVWIETCAVGIVGKAGRDLRSRRGKRERGGICVTIYRRRIITH